jgi:hypothetical protein
MFSDQDKTERVTAGLGGSEEGADAGMISGFGKFHTNKNGDNPYSRLEWSDILAMVDAPQQDVKKDDAQWLIPSSLDSRVHQEQFDRGCFHALWADCDWKNVEEPLSMTKVAQVVASLIDGADYEVYASRSAKDDQQKCRILIPLDKPLSGGDWVMAQRVLNALLEEAGIPPDTASEGAGQLCYLPNRGAFYDAINQRGRYFFNPLVSWKDPIAAIRQEDQAQADALEAKRDAMRKHGDSLKAADVGQGGPSLIQTFNATFSIDDILIQAGYDQRGQHFRHPQSETGSFSASVKDGRVYSLSSSDPLYTGDHAHDAFSAFTVLFHRGDQRKALIDAGDKWLMIGAESWNAVQRRKFTEERASRDQDRTREHATNGGFSLKSFSIRGDSQQMKQKMLADVFVLGRLALLGQVTHIYAAPNAGKTLITMWLLAGGIEAGTIDPGNVFYINADDNHKGLVNKTELAEKLGFEMLAPGHKGFSPKDFPKHLKSMIDEDSATGVILILDTVKKFTSLMNKNEAADFGAVLREFSLKGGTVIGLAHVNKHRNEDGKPVYQGTTDLKDDADCTYILDITNDGDEYRTVTFTNDKNRGDVAREVTYRYLSKPSASWDEKYLSIKTVGEDEMDRMKAQIESDRRLEKNADCIDAIISALSSGPLNQSGVLQQVDSENGISRKTTRAVLKAHCGPKNHYGQFWTEKKGEKNASLFSLNMAAQSAWIAKKASFRPGGVKSENWKN